ncbi:Putative aliphatic sulfonates transport permease protein SsuC [Vibrio aerogenes CECT 7868]|uniref:Putative aliphatic sulfonates transport permease protein SsuC n=1 Tax=Vibrio aerogenes CECT 7868 TaxID=1216006 RepID=A0A1M5ZIE0_9VIBR|nr:ABC transporter permease [Vibrio aerogenes]SHI23894.1 Putative aliphatic sulfonates transport permease protein SsuC [Vibrio aerogenes CECT 7868]
MTRLINRKPSRPTRLMLGILPFAILLVIYLIASDARLAVNPADKLLPAFHSFASAIERMAFTPSRRTGEYLLWADTFASLQRLGIGVGLSALFGLCLGIANGMVPLVRASLSPFVTAISLIPPMAVLPILFISLGLGEVSKVALIFVGICPMIIRDMQLKTQSLPEEQLIKAQTLGGNSWQIIVRVITPQVFPHLIDAVRLTLGSAWLFLIAAEAIVATEGLGYRIFLVRRYLSMDVILPYVLWITLLAYLMDWLLKLLSRKVSPWYHQSQGA